MGYEGLLQRKLFTLAKNNYKPKLCLGGNGKSDFMNYKKYCHFYVIHYLLTNMPIWKMCCEKLFSFSEDKWENNEQILSILIDKFVVKRGGRKFIVFL